MNVQQEDAVFTGPLTVFLEERQGLDISLWVGDERWMANARVRASEGGQPQAATIYDEALGDRPEADLVEVGAIDLDAVVAAQALPLRDIDRCRSGTIAVQLARDVAALVKRIAWGESLPLDTDYRRLCLLTICRAIDAGEMSGVAGNRLLRGLNQVVAQAFARYRSAGQAEIIEHLCATLSRSNIAPLVALAARERMQTVVDARASGRPPSAARRPRSQL